MRYDEMTQSVLEHVGGEVNVASVVHCATRLRFRLNDESKADTAALEATAGVIAVVTSGGQLQVVVGNDVPQAYAELGKIMNLGGDQGAGARAVAGAC
ncbi:PTS transporter subunit EIIB [Sanguibacter sp. 4.1]|uniref:PTS transporter subunit EIIB n=1 Tax=Sanguibacter biliveldensis TaxID=3030830 RepID=A0AAF0Z1K6_9MICO|nr:PTS transporter subunit EIIB [Sanguibacter sp. 4.1]WPF81460.1 PTS transporter subunit EIIB [Sanguibacter sp. 4.1]